MELFSITFMRWDIFVGIERKPLWNKLTGVFGDRLDREIWIRGRVNIVISDIKADRTATT